MVEQRAIYLMVAGKQKKERGSGYGPNIPFKGILPIT
jgi:hypothetical protein